MQMSSTTALPQDIVDSDPNEDIIQMINDMGMKLLIQPMMLTI